MQGMGMAQRSALLLAACVLLAAGESRQQNATLPANITTGGKGTTIVRVPFSPPVANPRANLTTKYNNFVKPGPDPTPFVPEIVNRTALPRLFTPGPPVLAINWTRGFPVAGEEGGAVQPAIIPGGLVRGAGGVLSLPRLAGGADSSLIAGSGVLVTG